MSLTPEKAQAELQGNIVATGALTVVLMPATGAIVARVLGQPVWYGLVAGGWVVLGLSCRTLRLRLKALADYKASADATTEWTVEVRTASKKLQEAIQTWTERYHQDLHP